MISRFWGLSSETVISLAPKVLAHSAQLMPMIPPPRMSTLSLGFT